MGDVHDQHVTPSMGDVQEGPKGLKYYDVVVGSGPEAKVSGVNLIVPATPACAP